MYRKCENIFKGSAIILLSISLLYVIFSTTREKHSGITSRTQPNSIVAGKVVDALNVHSTCSTAWMIKTDRKHIGVQLNNEFDLSVSAKNRKAKKQIEKYCTKHRTDPQSDADPNLRNFFVVEKYKIVYCGVPKVACTVWKGIMAKLQGLNISNGIHKNTKGKLTTLSNYSVGERETILKTYRKFLFVREPFERLLSAYKDCFWGKYKTKQDYWKDYQGKIKQVLMSRTSLPNETYSGNVTFEQFATYLVLRRREGGLFQEHWREQYKLCHPCRIQFDYIGHYETMAEDAMFILRKTNLENKVNFPEWQPTDTRELMQKYYSTLSLLRIRQLQSIYNNDLELFGYSYPGPLKAVVDNLINDKL